MPDIKLVDDASFAIECSIAILILNISGTPGQAICLWMIGEKIGNFVEQVFRKLTVIVRETDDVTGRVLQSQVLCPRETRLRPQMEDPGTC